MWGRTLKDVFQRYKGMRGFRQRYQNGYDCQGLWVEVGVERELGLNSKPEIEEYGLAEFARRCREKVAWSAEAITEQSLRLGMWMDWGNDYFTFSDTNIEYTWRFFKVVHENGWLTKGHRATEWCPRCGTSISQHELAGYYFDKTDPSLFVRFPLKDARGEALVVWTTTPWTLPANVAAAVSPDAYYGLLENGDWVAVARSSDLEPVRVVKGSELVGLEYTGPFDHLPAAAAVTHRVIPWAEVSLEEGSGIVHIAPGCGTEDFELSKEYDLPVLAPVDEAGRFYDAYGWLHGTSTTDAKDQIIGDLHERGLLVEAGRGRAPLPVLLALRDAAHLPPDRRLVHHGRPDSAEAPRGERLRRLGSRPLREADGRLAAEHGRLEHLAGSATSASRFPSTPVPAGQLIVVGSLAELRGASHVGTRGARGAPPTVDRRRADSLRRVRKRGRSQDPRGRGRLARRGIVPFSTLGWRSPERVEGGYATGASRGLSTADLPDHAYWEEWFPADWVTEMREQIRLWFYAQLFMSVVLVGRAPYRQVLSYEKLLDEAGREMHGSLGNAIDADEAFERMGADVMRWMYCAQPPSQNIRFGFGPAEEVKRKLLTLWNSVSFLVTYAEIEGFAPAYADLGPDPAGDDLRPLDRWLFARTATFLAESQAAYESFMTVGVMRAFESFVDDLSNWYIRRSRRRFYSLDEAAFRTLWTALVQGLRVVAPIMPFLTEHLWRNLVAGTCPDAPPSVFLAGWPEPASGLADDRLVADVAAARQAIELGRAARQSAGVEAAPAARTVVVCALDPELRAAVGRQVEEVGGGAATSRRSSFDESPDGIASLRANPRLDLVGPRFGPELPELRRRLAEGDFTLDDGKLTAGQFTLVPGEFSLEYVAGDGWALAQDADFVVAIGTAIDEELELEGRALDVIHTIQRLRKDSGLEITDRIEIRWNDDGDLAEVFSVHGERIAHETLAVRIERRARARRWRS